MNHLLNALAGFGSAINALGTAPKYTLPSVGDRSKDMRKIASDFSTVGRRMGKNTARALSDNYVKIDNGSGSK